MRLFTRGIVKTTTSSLSNSSNTASIPRRINVNSLPHHLASQLPLSEPANHHRHHHHEAPVTLPLRLLRPPQASCDHRHPWEIPTSSISSGLLILDHNLVKSSALRHPRLVFGRSSLARRGKGSPLTAADVCEVSPSSNMARHCIDLTSDDEPDSRASSLQNARVNSSANTQKKPPGDTRPRTQGKSILFCLTFLSKRTPQPKDI